MASSELWNAPDLATGRRPATRIWAILARESDVAVVLRRGPTKQVLLTRWHRSDDSFFFGQWFKGRIYERRCDLSPSGERFLYFAADQKMPYFSWTAISRPPFLTALALWPKGDCWGGGGQFVTEKKILLNHRPDCRRLGRRTDPRARRNGLGGLGYQRRFALCTRRVSLPVHPHGRWLRRAALFARYDVLRVPAARAQP